jgi:hypothetical protein
MASDLAALEPGSPLARVLWEVWSGTPVTIVPSPPGAGKTTLLVDLVAHLYLRAGIHIVIATPTNRGGADVAGRLARKIGMGPDGNPRVNVPGDRMRTFLDEESLSFIADRSGAGIEVVTVAGLASRDIKDPRLMILDEGWQTTFADLARAADPFEQMVMVGDPGQIGPVVTVPTRAWEGNRFAPHVPAPAAFLRRPDAVQVHLSHTYRLGDQGASIVAPLYDFPFDSKRPMRWLEMPDGHTLDEVSHLNLGAADDPFDPGMLADVARHATSLIGGRFVEAKGQGKDLEGGDIAVVVSRNAQRAFLEARLSQVGITVGTADSLQGGQWPAVIALDPMIGYSSATSFALAPGRLCVMLSRHMGHVTWVHGDGWREAIERADLAADESEKGMTVRETLMGTEELKGR